MTQSIKPEEWEKEKAGIPLETLLYHADKLLVSQRREIKDSYNYIINNIIRDSNSPIVLCKVDTETPDVVFIGYRVKVHEQLNNVYVKGFLCSIDRLYGLWAIEQRNRRLRECPED